MPQIPIDTSLDLTTLGAIETIARHMVLLNTHTSNSRYNYPGISDADWIRITKRAYAIAEERGVSRRDVGAAIEHLSSRNQE